MQLDITDFVASACPKDYSASKAELGESAGADTWRAACDDSDDYPLLDTDDKRDAFRVFVRASGGWNDAEIAAFSDLDLNALCLQWVAGDMRECGIERAFDGVAPDWVRIECEANEGRIAGRIYPGADGRIYFSIEG